MDVDAIGRVRSARTEPLDDGWDAAPAAVELDGDRFGPEALAGPTGPPTTPFRSTW